MISPRRFSALLVLACVTAFPAAFAQNQPLRTERIQASYMVAFGRAPTSGELTHWSKQGDLSVAKLIELHRQYLRTDRATQRTAITRSYIDALGRNPTDAEITHWSKGTDTYTQLMKNHIAWLTSSPAEYEKVIQRSYQAVFRRAATAAELTYWKRQGVMSYMMLIGSHDQWKQQNAAGSSRTSGTPSISGKSATLVLVPLSAAVAAETRAATAVASGGGNVIAAGGGNVIAAGGGNVIAAGGANVVAAGGRN